MNNLTLGMLCDINDKHCHKKFPKMKLKAAEATACVEAFLFLWKRKMDPTNKTHIWIKLALQASANMDAILEANSSEWKLSAGEYRKFLEYTKTYSVCTLALQQYFWDNECRRLFQSGTFKGHWLLHIAQLSQYVHPRLLWCYSGESFMSTCKTLMQACLKGRSSLSSLRKFIERYNIALSMDLANVWHLK